MPKILHFADSHIDMANYGRQDPETGLPLRVMDFLRSLDEIVDTAISEKVDLVLFAGDAYKNRDPAPTFQREWGKRIMRLSDAQIPTILTAHATVEGAVYGGERTVLLGKDFVLPKSLVADPRLDYAALGHIHKAQNLNEGNHPPVIYSGSIERVDFGEVRDDKFFVMAEVEKGHTDVDWRKLSGIRSFHDHHLKLDKQENITDQVIAALPALEQMADAVVRLVLEYPRAWAPLIDDRVIQEHASDAFEFHLVKRPQMDERIRLPQDQTVGDLTPAELLEKFWQASHVPEKDVEALQKLAAEILQEEEETEELAEAEAVEVESTIPALQEVPAE